MNHKFVFLFVLCFVIALLAGCGSGQQQSVEKIGGELPLKKPGDDFKFSPAEQAELDKAIREHGTDAISAYVIKKQYPGVDSDRVLDGVKYLLSQGADIQSGLSGVARTRHVNVAELLISKGANVNGSSGQTYTPLHRAASDGEIEMVKFLVSKGASIDTKDSIGYTPLDTAKRWNHQSVVEYLSSLQK